jgi:hypothetical protein
LRERLQRCSNLLHRRANQHFVAITSAILIADLDPSPARLRHQQIDAVLGDYIDLEPGERERQENSIGAVEDTQAYHLARAHFVNRQQQAFGKGLAPRRSIIITGLPFAIISSTLLSGE